MNVSNSRLTAVSLALILALLGVGHLLRSLGHIQTAAALPTATFTVSNLNDSGAGSLRQAILNANATAGADVIQITAVGTLQLLSALPIIDEALTIQGPGMAQLAVAGGSGFRVFESTAVPLTVTDLTVQNGAPASDTGGGIRSLGTLTLTNVAVLSNTSPVGGGGVYVVGEAHLVNGRFENNRSLGSIGGGLLAESTALITGTQFISNTSPGQGGGALVNNLSVLRDVRFERNRSLSANGGGLYASGIVTLVNATLISNTAFGDGGGMLAFGQANVYGSRFIDNVCADQGGGMYVGSFLTVKQSVFVGNRGGRGGAIFHGALNGLLENSLLAENTATNAGDQLFLNSTYPVTLNYVTAVGTTGGMGTGIHVTNTPLLISNTIIASHTLGLNILNGSVTQDYNLFFGNGTDIQGTVFGGTHNATGDPRFVNPAAANYHLRHDSAAIDAGSDTGVLVDYDGDVRPRDNGFDIGFDEGSLLPPPQEVYLPLVTR
jgi:predicted outer membrane repeat protein